MPLRSPLRAALFAAIALVTLALDLLTKQWADRLAAPHDALGGLARFVRAHNPDGAFSVFHDMPATVRLPLFLAVTIVALCVLAWMYARAGSETARLGIALVAGGALGNLVDRLRFGYVVDFIDVSAVWRGVERHWPTFNVADVAIVAGVGLLLVSSLTSRRARSSPS